VDLPYNGKLIQVLFHGSTMVVQHMCCKQHMCCTTIYTKWTSRPIYTIWPAGYVQSRFSPRNSASVIQKITVKINGGIKVDIPDYNFVYNMLHDYIQGGDALKRRQTGGENSDPSNKLYITANDIIERRGAI
jgi:hypothetical protein